MTTRAWRKPPLADRVLARGASFGQEAGAVHIAECDLCDWRRVTSDAQEAEAAAKVHALLHAPAADRP